jgi:hypothetical protein
MTPLAKLSWSSMDDPAWKLDDYSLKPLTPSPHHSIDADMVDYQDYVLVITGDVFRWMINNAPLETLQRVCALNPALCVVIDAAHADACTMPGLRTYVPRREERSC